MKHILIVDGHPDPSEERLNHALAGRYAKAVQAAGHEVRRITLAHTHVPLLRSVEDFLTGSAPESLRDAQRDILWADHLVFFFPLWHGNVPALLKAFIEQTLRPGFAMDYGGKGRFPKQLFKGKSARVVVTMGMPAFFYRAYFGAYGVKGFERSTLALCGIGPIYETLLGRAGENRVRAAKWLDFMDVLAKQDLAPQAARRSQFGRTALRTAVLLAGSYAAYVLLSSAARNRTQSPFRRTPAQDAAPSATSELAQV